MNTPENVCKSLDLLALEILDLLKQELSWFDKKFGNYQKKSDVQKGVVKKGTIFVPLSSVEHRILFDGYEFALIETFYTLYRELYVNKENIFTEFSFRTLLEVGFYRIQILYSSKISDSDKVRYKLLLLLADFASLGLEHEKHKNSFIKLLKEHYQTLNKFEQTTFQAMLDILEKKDVERHPSLVVKVRNLVSLPQDYLYKLTEPVPVLKDKKIKDILSSLSHILHGNFLLLQDMFSENGKGGRHTLRAYWFLIMAGVNVVNYAASYSKEKDFINSANEISNKYSELDKIIKQSWRVLERYKK